jgi:hypothetical protein
MTCKPELKKDISIALNPESECVQIKLSAAFISCRWLGDKEPEQPREKKRSSFRGDNDGIFQIAVFITPPRR